MAYEELGVEIDPNVLAEQGFDLMRAAHPGWEPVEGAPETMLIETGARWAADAGYLLSTWADRIFRFFGETMHNLPREEATSATVTSTWTARDTTGYTIEAGTEVQVQDASGEWIGFEVVDEVVIAPASSATVAGEVELSAIEPGIAGNGLSGTAETVDALAWLSSIALIGSSAGGEDEETDDDYMTRLVRRLQLMSPTPILPADFAVLATDVATVYRALARDNYNPYHNLLSVNQASLETDTTGWAADTNCAISRTTVRAKDGSASLRLTSNAAGSMDAATPVGVAGVPVTGGQIYTAAVSVQPDTLSRSTKLGIRWYDSGGAQIGANVYGPAVASVDNAWTLISVTAVAPATAAFAAISPWVDATAAAGEIHDFDEFVLREGSEVTPWAAGGTAKDNNAATVTVAVMASDGTEPTTQTIAEVKTYLESLRETGFVVHVIGPEPNQIDVTYAVKLAPDADETEVLAAVDAALNEYLSAATWGTPASGESDLWEFTDRVRRGEIYTVINNVGGVDYVDSLSIDGSTAEVVTLYGIAPVTTPGTMTGSVV